MPLLQEGRTPLHRAAAAGLPGVISLLLASGADPNAPSRSLRTPLHSAAALFKLSLDLSRAAKGVELVDGAGCAQLLLAGGAAPDARDAVRSSPLIKLLRTSHFALRPPVRRELGCALDLRLTCLPVPCFQHTKTHPPGRRAPLGRAHARRRRAAAQERGHVR